jgi:acyl carrier protein
MSTLVQLNLIFQDVFDDPQLVVGADTTSTDLLDWDSVAQVKLVLSIEEAFGIRFTSDEPSNIHRVGDFITAVEGQIGSTR